MSRLSSLTSQWVENKVKTQLSDYGTPNELVLLRMLVGGTAAFLAKTVVDALYAKYIQAPEDEDEEEI